MSHRAVITEIETVLINIYSADIDSILKKSQEFAEDAQQSIEDMVEDAENKVLFKDYGRAVENYYQIIELAYDIQDYDAAKKYTDRLNEILKMGTKEKREKKDKKKKK